MSAWMSAVATVVGSGGVAAVVAAVAGRRKMRAETEATEAQADSTHVDTATTLAQTALEQVTGMSHRLDRAEQRMDDFRRALYPHQTWDVKAHRTALEVDPDFPAPPDLSL